jgi:hypothetical protein
MLKLITTLTVILFGLLAKGQNHETRIITDFNKMEVKNAKVIYTESDKSSLTIESEYNDTPETILTEMVNGTLKIKGIDASESTVVYVSGKASDFKLNSKAEITANNLITTNATVTLNSGSAFHGCLANASTTITGGKDSYFKGAVNTGKLTAIFSSNARAILTGKAVTADISAKSSVLCHARNFTSDKMHVSADGNSKVTVYSAEKIGIDVIEDAHVTYNGTPKELNLNENAILNKKSKDQQVVTYNY